ERVAKTGGIFDKEKLNWVNEHYIRGKTADEITDLCIPYLKEAGYITDEDVKNRYEWLKTMVTTVQENLSTTKDIVDKVDFFFNDKVVIEDDKALEVIEGEQVPELLNAFEEAVSEEEEIDEDFAKGIMKKIQKQTGIKGKNLFMPTRVALTGAVHGPEMVNIIYVLGKQNILKRIDYIKENYLK